MARFSHHFLDELKSRLTLSDIVGRKVKLVRKGREHGGLCPFHSEKTPSFTVNDQKAFYHCFGCGVHGSAIDFVMETEGLSFPETIERLAGEVGMPLPIPDPEEAKRDARRSTLAEVMATVTSWYESQLRGQNGRHALTYIQGRGLSDATIKRFQIGFAPDSRTALKEAMTARDITEEQLIETGMLIKPEGGGASYDRFRGRVMFPIQDLQSRVIAFGGRALSSDVKAKYLNSPETSLFHKGATLYNWARARKAAYESGNVIVVEGYMDVIALSEFGLDYAVAPLGTALTEDQIGHLWRMADEPTLSFDGDKAGRRAAARAVERALPLLKAGKSLRFMIMPDGDDPDTLVQREGLKAIEKLIDQAVPLVDMLWQNFIGGRDASTPERRAGLEKDIFIKLAEIDDENIQKLYQSEFRSRLWRHFRSDNGQSQNKPSGRRAPEFRQGYWASVKDQHKGLRPNPGRHAVRASGIAATALGRATGSATVPIRLEKLLLATIINHPEILVRHVEELADIEFGTSEHERLRTGIISETAIIDHLERETLLTRLHDAGLARELNDLFSHQLKSADWFATDEAALGDALIAFEHLLARFQHLIVASEVMEEARRDFAEEMNDINKERFLARKEQYDKMRQETNQADIKDFGLESNKTQPI